MCSVSEAATLPEPCWRINPARGPSHHGLVSKFAQISGGRERPSLSGAGVPGWEGDWGGGDSRKGGQECSCPELPGKILKTLPRRAE